MGSLAFVYVCMCMCVCVRVVVVGAQAHATAAGPLPVMTLPPPPPRAPDAGADHAQMAAWYQQAAPQYVCTNKAARPHSRHR
jgi:hypothetical protein